ncbi:TMEM175 family protein [Micromonospora yasonensis]|uniref:TMEM175 family protein n=1 Tax=Micromonospora yasonensis TaxID=1128667 RepID=UPI00222E2DC9|nr:TMEM175 family protein [Micromonospora yasonensis]MCW3839540.1 TMEM175 family protein [Micromonospora yasonensis]
MSEEPAGAGPGQRPDLHRRRERTLQRTTAFTDAGVAIALTLLVLPLVDFADQSTARKSVAQLFAEHVGDVLSFAVSFLVIALFWRTHRHLYEQLVDYDESLLILNTMWLMAVVFLPFPTARLFVETRLRTDSAVLYLCNMLVISLLALAQVWWVVRHPDLRAPSSPLTSRALAPPVALSVTFAVAALAAIASPAAGLWVLACLPLAQYLAIRLSRPATG